MSKKHGIGIGKNQTKNMEHIFIYIYIKNGISIINIQAKQILYQSMHCTCPICLLYNLIFNIGPSVRHKLTEHRRSRSTECY